MTKNFDISRFLGVIFSQYSQIFTNLSKMFAKNVTKLLSTGKNITNIRQFSVTSVRGEIVKIQSTEDFKNKVINSKVPVIVDFFAT